MLVQLALILSALLFVRFCYVRWWWHEPLLHLPWAGSEGMMILPQLRARIWNMVSSETAIKAAHENYTVKNQSFVFATADDNLVVLPPDHMDWITSQPEEVLSNHQIHVDIVLADLTHPSPNIVRNPIHKYTISRDLTRNLANLTEDIIDELGYAVDLFWPKAEDHFEDVQVFSSLVQVVARTSNRIFVGFPLCRNRVVLDNAIGFVQGVALWATLLKLLPEWCRPLAAKVCLYQNRQHISGFNKIIIPEIEKRQAAMADAEKAHAANPNDMVQWLINRAEEFGGIERDSSMIAGRLLSLNFAAIHSTTFSVTNVIFDLLNSRPEDRWIEQLREEARTALAESNGVWTKQSLARLYKIDSTLRESSRVGTILAYSMMRKVVVEEGITSPNGTYLPYGVTVAIPTDRIHHEATNYSEPDRYDPFRFSRQRDIHYVEDTSGEYIKKANMAFVSTSPIYHPWGHGKHGCPGRFFAANELKLLLAYLVLNYDFELMDKRPKSRLIGSVRVAPMSASIRVRRRVNQ